MSVSLASQLENYGDPILCNYLVACVDLLGQSEKLLDFRHADQIHPESPSYQNWLKETFGSVRLFRQAFSNFISSINAQREDSRLPTQLTLTDIRIIPASDSLIIYSSLYDPDGSRTVKNINSIVTILQALGALAPFFIARNKPFRAGVAIGLGAEYESIGFYGPAIPLACELEKEADYPRILIDPYIMEYLQAFSTWEDNSPSSRFGASQAQYAIKLIFQDCDGRWALDFLGTSIRKIYMNSILKDKDLHMEGYTQIQRNIAYCKNLKVRSKYLLLKEYYDSRASAWYQNGAQ
jgi:hypothetical protein